MYCIVCLCKGIVFLDFRFLVFPILFSGHGHINLVYILPHTVRWFCTSHIVYHLYTVITVLYSTM